jgi:hypothetical protein
MNAADAQRATISKLKAEKDLTPAADVETMNKLDTRIKSAESVRD